jgi:hypothetical protein
MGVGVHLEMFEYQTRIKATFDPIEVTNLQNAA